MKKVRAPWITGVPDRGAMLVLEGSANICVLVNPECCVCAWTSDLLSLLDEEEEGDLPVYGYILLETICTCCGRQHLVCGSLTGHISVLCACMSLGHVLHFATNLICN